MDLNEKVLKRLLLIKQNCKICNGTGYSIKFEDNFREFIDCECVVKIRKYASYIEANIPPRYGNWDISELTEEFKTNNANSYALILDYIDNLDTRIAEGTGFWIAGPPGQAKSSIIAYILKQACDHGHPCYFEKAANLHSKKFEALSNEDAKNFIEYLVSDVNLLAIEEFDKLYLKDDLSFNNKAIFDLISDLYDSNKSLIVSSNEHRDVVLKRYPTFISDRLCAIDYIPLFGKVSGRR